MEPSPDAIRWPQVRRRAFPALGVFAALVLVLAIQCWWLQRPLEAIEAHGGMLELENTPIVSDMFRDYRCTAHWIPEPVPRPIVFLEVQYTLRRGCSLYFNHGISDEELALVRDLRCVSRLSVPNSTITDEGLRSLRGMEKLERLDLYGSRLTGEGFRHLRDLPHLRDLVLSRTSVTDEGLANLTDLPMLADLDLRRTRVTDRGLKHLANLPSLRSIELSSTAITDEGLRVLAALPLESLEIRNTNVTDAGMSHLVNHPTLTYLDIRRTAVSNATVEVLRRAGRFEAIDSCQVNPPPRQVYDADDDRDCF